MKKTILLASFVNKENLKLALDSIENNAKIDRQKIFIFVDENTKNDYICTYNISPEYANIKFTEIWKNTISIHRKKQFNILYSINAMNELIKIKNNGVFSSSFMINWEEYENSLMIIKNGNLNIIPIKLIRINQ